MAWDPVCFMNVNENEARTKGWTTEYAGKTHYFCSEECKELFASRPTIYWSPLPEGVDLGAREDQDISAFPL